MVELTNSNPDAAGIMPGKACVKCGCNSAFTKWCPRKRRLREINSFTTATVEACVRDNSLGQQISQMTDLSERKR